MSVILDLTVFPTDQGVSLARFVAPVIAMIQDSGFDHQLSPMGTQIETQTLSEALALIERAQSVLDALGCERVYIVAKFDIRRGACGRLTGKVESVRRQLAGAGSGSRLDPPAEDRGA
jgi:uncharacterized protein (TIGR00106 family)